jgi:hypothetical protein
VVLAVGDAAILTFVMSDHAARHGRRDAELGSDESPWLGRLWLPLWIGMRGPTQNQATDEIAGVHFVSDFSPKAGIQMRLCAGDRAVMRLPPTMRLLTILNYRHERYAQSFVCVSECMAFSSYEYIFNFLPTEQHGRFRGGNTRRDHNMHVVRLL